MTKISKDYTAPEVEVVATMVEGGFNLSSQIEDYINADKIEW